MSLEVLMGRGQQLAGRLCEFWGRLTGDELSRMHGYQLVALGQMRVLGGRAASLLRYCTPRQALAVRPILAQRRFSPGGRAP